MQYYWRSTRGLTMGAQGCVITEDNRILLIKHTYRPGWHFPGGGVEKNETIKSALERELHEEANIDITGEPELFAMFTNFEFFPSDHIALFIVRHWEQKSAPKPNMEIANHGFFALDTLPEDTHPSTRARIEEIINGTPPSDAW
ncbi:MAG: NUDIX domain-containing protein [Alphaproteobacteria bacterium]|nr:NUDIX domain-containing protein [Alphaproteobacteria bacterium]